MRPNSIGEQTMKRIIPLKTFICALLLSGVALAQEVTNVIERTALPSRIHRTWEGDYQFSGESILKISGLKDLHVLKYRRSGSEGDIIDFAEPNENGDLTLLCEGKDNFDGVVPVFESVSVLPDAAGAEIIVRWRHPGNGGFLTVEKYFYTLSKLELLTRSHTIDIDGERQWISENDLKRRQEQLKASRKYPAVREAAQGSGVRSGEAGGSGVRSAH